MTRTVLNCFAYALQVLGEDWADNHTPQAIRWDSEKVDLLLRVRDLSRNPISGMGYERLCELAPTFVEQYEEVLLQSFPRAATPRVL